MGKIHAAILAAGLSLAPAAADAQFQTYCSPTTPDACVGVQFAGTGASTVVRVQNLQGSIGGGSLAWFDIQRIVFDLNTPGLAWIATDPDREEVPGHPRSEGCFSTTVGLLLVGNDCMRPMAYGDVEGGPDGAVTAISGSPFVASGILGCGLNSWVPDGDFVAATCPATGLNGWVEFALGFHLFDASGTFVRWTTPEDLTVSIAGYTDLGDEVTIDGIPGSVSTVPEPATVALLGGGLALLGVGGVVRRRRAVA